MDNDLLSALRNTGGSGRSRRSLVLGKTASKDTTSMRHWHALKRAVK